MAEMVRETSEVGRGRRGPIPPSPPRGVLFGQLLRAGPERAGPIFDKLNAAGIAAIVKHLSPAELALCAALACAPARLEHTKTLPVAVLSTLARAARVEDRERLVASLGAERGEALLRSLDDGRLGRGERGLGLVLRLRRLFRR